MERIYSGHLKTSLEMHGFQICLLHLNPKHGDLWLRFLDAETEVTGWVGSAISIGTGESNIGDDEGVLKSSTKKVSAFCFYYQRAVLF